MKKVNMLLTIFLLLVACSDPTTDGSDSGDVIDIGVLASEKKLPADFEEIAFRREEPPHYQFLIKKAGNKAQAEKWWSAYRLEEEVPSINFSEKHVFFVGLYESGTCPVEIGDIKVNADKDMMTIDTSVSDGACTTDATPRTIVFAIDRSVAENMEVIEMQTGVSTILPL